MQIVIDECEKRPERGQDIKESAHHPSVQEVTFRQAGQTHTATNTTSKTEVLNKPEDLSK